MRSTTSRFVKEYLLKTAPNTVFENHRKSLIQHCELPSHFEWTKINKKWSILASFLNIEACGQTVLPDRSIFIEQKLVQNAKIEN